MFIDKYHPGTGIVHLMGRSARLYNVMVVWGKNDEVFPGIVAAERPMGWVGSGTTLHLHLQAGSTLRYPNFACIFHTWRKCMDANRLQNLGVREKPETILIWMDHIPLCSFKHDFLPCILQSVAFTEISRILLHFGSIFRSDDLPKVEAGR